VGASRASANSERRRVRGDKGCFGMPPTALVHWGAPHVALLTCRNKIESGALTDYRA